MVNKDILENKFQDDLVCVITPVYNAQKYIKATVESVIAQTYKNIEIILVDDCSKDNSRKIIEEMMKQYSNIVYHLQEVNAGAAVARNKALELAKGRYVAFLDSDDLWYPEKLEKQLKLMKEKNTSFSYTAIEVIDEEDKLTKGKRKLKEKATYKTLLKNTLIATSSVVIDRKLMGDFRMPLIRSGQDYATWLQLLRGDVTAYGINEALVKYRRSSNSLSSNKFKSIEQVIGIQIKQEHINPIKAYFNGFCFIVNALKKYIF